MQEIEKKNSLYFYQINIYLNWVKQHFTEDHNSTTD